MRRTTLRTAVPLATASLLLTGIGLAAPSSASAELVHAAGTFTSTGPTYTYSPDTVSSADRVPSGATAEVRVVATAAGTTVATLQVRGFPANRTYGVHAHIGPCGILSGTSLGHYQNVVGTGSSYVNDENELWLGFTANEAGNGRAQSVVDWQFRPGGAQSITFHYGAANVRVACMPVAF